MIMLFAAAVVAGRARAAVELIGEARFDEGFERLINRRQADVRHLLANGLIDVVGRGMVMDLLEVGVDGGSLRSVPAASGAKRAANLLRSSRRRGFSRRRRWLRGAGHLSANYSAGPRARQANPCGASPWLWWRVTSRIAASKQEAASY